MWTGAGRKLSFAIADTICELAAGRYASQPTARSDTHQCKVFDASGFSPTGRNIHSFQRFVLGVEIAQQIVR